MKEIVYQPDYEGRKPLWGHALYPSQMILFTAPYKAGKSVLLMSLFGNLALGRQWGPWAPERPLRTIYVAFEDDVDDIQISMAPFGGTPNFRIISSEWTDDEKFSIKDFEKKYVHGVSLDKKPDIVSFDPWMYSNNFDPKDPVKMRTALEVIRKFARSNDIAVFLVHHDRKPDPREGDDPWYSAAGSHVLGAAVDAQWNIIKPAHGPRSFQITYARKRATELIKLVLAYNEDKGGIGVQYKGGAFHYPDARIS